MCVSFYQHMIVFVIIVPKDRIKCSLFCRYVDQGDDTVDIFNNSFLLNKKFI
jgi:hypothetical protein